MEIKIKKHDETAWKFNQHSMYQPESWLITYRDRIKVEERRDGSKYLIVSTVYGIMEADEGDIIIHCAADGGLKIYKPDVFDLLYDITG